MNQSIGLIEPPEPEEIQQPKPKALFDIGDVCVLKQRLQRDFGVVPKGAIVEVAARHENRRLYVIKTTDAPVLTITGVKGEDLEDYETNHPARLVH